MSDPDTKPLARPGDLTRVSMRVKLMRVLVQTEGHFSLLADSGEPPFAALSALPEWTFERVGETSLELSGLFSFQGCRHTGTPEKPDAPGAAFVQVDARFKVIYDLNPGEVFSDDDANAFANINGTLNVHPFFREYVHSTLSRAGLSPFLLPPFNPIKMGILRPKSKDSTAPSSGGSK